VVRLVDYLLVEGALDMLVTTIDKFRFVMDTQPVICVQLSFAEKGMNFNANEEEARQVCAFICTGWYANEPMLQSFSWSQYSEAVYSLV
jgi:hypothetical protein